MVFKRRKPRSYQQVVTEWVYPRGGWKRAITYLGHRLRRLPDQPHRIARGVGAGVFISFTPFFGVHFLTAAIAAWVVRGNLLAALLATFVGNPVTFPLIGFAAVELGQFILGGHGPIAIEELIGAFSQATIELWTNVIALFTDDVVQWRRFDFFFKEVFLPYFVGGVPLGLIAGIAAHYLTLPVVGAYQKRRVKKLRDRAERLRSAARLRAESAEAAAAAGLEDPKKNR